MMRVELKKLTIKNFKGIRDLTINFKETTDIYGDNGCGKTTIFDAYLWLLFDKDSNNCKDFNIKTLDSNGTVIPNLDHTVKAVLSVDGEEISLCKTYKEVYTKKRGSNTETFSGHTTDYFINEVPVKKSEYTSYISNLIDEEKFKLISNIRYFNVDLDKKKKREILMSISNIKDEDVIKLDDDFKELDLEKYTTDELKKMYKSSLKKINDELKEIPARIDELSNSLYEVNEKEIQDKLSDKKKELEETTKTIETKDNSSQLEEISKKINELNSKKYSIMNEIDSKNSAEEQRIRNLKTENKNKIAFANERLQRQLSMIETYNSDIQKNESQIQKLRTDWEELNQKKYDGQTVCPLCKQPLPADEITDLKEKFNVHKSEELQAIIDNANKLKDANERMSAELNTLNDDVVRINDEIKNLKAVEFEELIFIHYPDEIQELENEVIKLKMKLAEQNDMSKSEELESKRKALLDEISELNKQLAYIDMNEITKKKIREYENSEKKLSNEYSNIERLLYIVEQFELKKSELISDDISKHFKLVDFKLFDVQINGGITEVCEATINGVPFSDANNASKINAGIDIINTLSDKFETYVPVFVDNAESINKIIDTKSQLIRLVVSKDKELRVDA